MILIDSSIFMIISNLNITYYDVEFFNVRLENFSWINKPIWHNLQPLKK